jgi:hypothetical protein
MVQSNEPTIVVREKEREARVAEERETRVAEERELFVYYLFRRLLKTLMSAEHVSLPLSISIERQRQRDR